jgi:hypothetical protein
MIYEKHGIKDFFQGTIHSNALDWQKNRPFSRKKQLHNKNVCNWIQNGFWMF